MKVSDVVLDYHRIDGDDGLPTLVFLHEGLGSIELWRDFPARVAETTGHSALVYSRQGHGWSDPLTGPRSHRYMHDEALVTLPAVLDELDIAAPILVGHSDGASIALIHAGAGDAAVTAVVAMAPHVFVEPAALLETAAARQAFEETDMAEKMSKYHHDPGATFHGWFDIWTSPAFRDWNIEDVLAGIDCPLVVVQGADDPYGTIAQLDAVDAGVPGRVERLWLSECGHSPHLDKAAETIEAAAEFIRRHATRWAPSAGTSQTENHPATSSD